MDTLKFSTSNQKMKDTAMLVGIPKNSVMSFDIPAGYTCPAADICLAKAERETGKLVKGKHMKFLCYAARIENQRQNVRTAHWFNFDLIKKNAGLNDPTAMADLIVNSLPKNARIVRIHSSGDLFNAAYYKAWQIVAERLPHVIFFGYTKMWAFAKHNQECNPDNLFIVYSVGGRDDNKAFAANVAKITVVASEEEAHAMGLPVTCSIDDDFDQTTKDKVTAILDKFGMTVKSWNGHANDFFAVIARIDFAIVVH